MEDATFLKLTARAQVTLASLYEPSLFGPNPGFPIKQHVGACRLCGNVTELTFEHIPPKVAGNASRRRGVDAVTAFQQLDHLSFPKQGYFHSQRGVGASVLCGDCNNWSGSALVPAYAELENHVLSIVGDNVLERNEVVYLPGRVQLELMDYRLGSVAREALVMLLAASGGASLTRRWPALQKIVRGAQSPLPKELALGLSLVFGPRARLAPACGVIGPGDKVTVLVEVACMPFAWTLSIGDDLYTLEAVGLDVSDWLSYSIEAEVRVSIELSAGSVQTAGTGDYRDSSQVTSAIESARRQNESMTQD